MGHRGRWPVCSCKQTWSLVEKPKLEKQYTSYCLEGSNWSHRSRGAVFIYVEEIQKGANDEPLESNNILRSVQSKKSWKSKFLEETQKSLVF